MKTIEQQVTISKKEFDAIVFDLDGVVTDTAAVHAATWKELFDDFLKRTAKEIGKEFQPFDEKEDYLRHVDGKPRYKGVNDFLQSRGISIPYGDSSDLPDKQTICGLGNRKNIIFNERLEKDGVVVFDSTVSLIRNAKSMGFKIGIISSSKNCEPVLKVAGLLDLFEVKVDGVDAAELDLKGKPHPDVFLAATEQLDVEPKRTVVVEDAIAGVRAGKRGNFGLVIGVDRTGIADELLEKGADVVVKDLAQVGVVDDPNYNSWLPSALESFSEIEEHLKGKRFVIFLDYDGTLTPIVERPEDAILSDAVRQTVKELSQDRTVAIVSGRDRQDVQERVGIDTLFYAGSHGFDIGGPEGFEKRHEKGEKFISTLDDAENDLQNAIGEIEGAQVERKKFSIASHYRRVADENVEEVKRKVDEVAEKYPSLKKSGGKKVIELQPDIDWHKGKAVLWLLEALELKNRNVTPIYIGDDLTDEDAFNALKDIGVGIVVSDKPKDTAALYALKNTDEVKQFLSKMHTLLKE